MKYIAEVCRAQVLLAHASAARHTMESELATLEVGSQHHIVLAGHLAELTDDITNMRASLHEVNQFIPGFE